MYDARTYKLQEEEGKWIVFAYRYVYVCVCVC